METCAWRNIYLDLIPHPLPYSGEVEILAAYGIAIQKRDSSSRRMSMCSPVSRLQQPGAEQAELYHLAADPINLHPVLNPHSVWSHQNKPTAECQDEILKDHRQSCCRQTQDCWHLPWYTEYGKQDQEETDYLHSQTENCFQGLPLARIANHPFQCVLE